MSLSSPFRMTFRALIFVIAISFSLSAYAEEYQFQFADLVNGMVGGTNEDMFRASYKVILSDITGSDKFKITVKTTIDKTAEDVYNNLKLNSYRNEQNKQIIIFEDDEQVYCFVNVWDGYEYAGKEFRIISKNKELPLYSQYTNNIFYKENPSAAHSLQTNYSVTYRSLIDYILKNHKIQKKTPNLETSLPSPIRRVDINELISHPFGLEDMTLHSSYDSILDELKERRYCVSTLAPLNTKTLSTEYVLNYESDCSPIIYLSLQMPANPSVTLSTDKFNFHVFGNTIYYQMVLHQGWTFDNGIPVKSSMPSRLSMKERNKLLKERDKLEEESFKLFVDMLKRAGFSMKNAKKDEKFLPDAPYCDKVYVGRKGDLKVSVGKSSGGDIYVWVVTHVK
ncbi:MAG: hypothetical protein K2K00_09310 [Muribaculaceae bacterium]|nr:hypothetical protein [Muribaculaceae bacterium]